MPKQKTQKELEAARKRRNAARRKAADKLEAESRVITAPYSVRKYLSPSKKEGGKRAGKAMRKRWVSSTKEQVKKLRMTEEEYLK